TTFSASWLGARLRAETKARVAHMVAGPLVLRFGRGNSVAGVPLLPIVQSGENLRQGQLTASRPRRRPLFPFFNSCCRKKLQEMFCNPLPEGFFGNNSVLSASYLGR